MDPWTRGPVDPWTRGQVGAPPAPDLVAWARGPVAAGAVDPWTRGPGPKYEKTILRLRRFDPLVSNI